MENRDAHPPTPCPKCGCTESKPKYNNNKKPGQLRVACKKCNRLFQLSPIRKAHPQGYKKQKVEEPKQYQVLVKQCDACKSTDAKFYSLNNNDPLQPRYKCKNPKCKKVFTPFKKSQLLNRKPAPDKDKQPTTRGDTATEINSLHMNPGVLYYNPLLQASETLNTWGSNSGYFHPNTVDTNVASTSYASAPNGPGYAVQIAPTLLYNAPSNHWCDSIAMYHNTTGAVCGLLGQNAQNIPGDPNTYNVGTSTNNQYGRGGSSVYQGDIYNLPPTQPSYPTFNNLPDATNICDNASTSSSSTLHHASLFSKAPHTLQDRGCTTHLTSGRPYNSTYLSLRQPAQNMFSGSIYQPPEGIKDDGHLGNDINSQVNILRQLGNDGPILRNHQDTLPHRPPQESD